jgi:hypothetical protein
MPADQIKSCTKPMDEHGLAFMLKSAQSLLEAIARLEQIER